MSHKKKLLLLVSFASLAYFVREWIRKISTDLEHEKKVLELLTRLDIDINDPLQATIQIRTKQRRLPPEIDGRELDALLEWLRNHWQRSGILPPSQPLPRRDKLLMDAIRSLASADMLPSEDGQRPAGTWRQPLPLREGSFTNNGGV